MLEALSQLQAAMSTILRWLTEMYILRNQQGVMYCSGVGGNLP